MQSLQIFAPKSRENLHAHHSSSWLPWVSSVPPACPVGPPTPAQPCHLCWASRAYESEQLEGPGLGRALGTRNSGNGQAPLPSAPLPAPGALQYTLIASMPHVRFSSSLVRPRAQAPRQVHTEVCRRRVPADAAGTHHCHLRRWSQGPCREFRCGFCWRKENPSFHRSKGTLSVHTEARGMGGREDECLSWGRRC